MRDARFAELARLIDAGPRTGRPRTRPVVLRRKPVRRYLRTAPLDAWQIRRRQYLISLDRIDLAEAEGLL